MGVLDAPTGVYKSATVTALLTMRADQDGLHIPIYAPVPFDHMGDLGELNDPASEVLVRQLRYLRAMVTEGTPELRIALPGDFGKSKWVIWYSPELDAAFWPGNRPLPTLATEIIRFMLEECSK